MRLSTVGLCVLSALVCPVVANADDGWLTRAPWREDLGEARRAAGGESLPILAFFTKPG